ncbi:alpha/beta fold hydrolase [Rhizobium sp. IMFF44]|uniref:alpha/beta fold hydrolase n=1 Tax=Rhizobium sp. IMFF44 TaxID=3342350 RepID=UPI0035B9FD50
MPSKLMPATMRQADDELRPNPNRERHSLSIPILWKQWSPTWAFEDETFERTTASFGNPDFVDVVIHSYRFHFGLAAGDPALVELEARLAAKPPISVPAITIDGTQDPLKPGGTADHAKMFKDRREHRVVECGHNLPWEVPREFADAVLTIRAWAVEGEKSPRPTSV